MKNKLAFILSLQIIFLFTSFVSNGQNNVLTQHNDQYRTGWNKLESVLTTKNVTAGSFGKLFTRTTDDQVYAQPLVKLNVNIPGIGNKNIVFVATVNNTVYAFDADSANINVPYWQVNLSPAGSRALKNTDLTGACGGGYRDFSGNIGIVGTPVIDPATNTLYVVSRDVTSSTVFEQYLHALDITTGAERPNSPVLITAQVSGNGPGNIAGIIHFDAQKQNQRPGLLLLNGIVYIAWASHCDWGPYHGWVIGYDKASLLQKIVYNTTPNGYFGGIWMSGGGPSADETGNIYVASGNGSIGTTGNPNDPVNRSESALKLTPSGNTLSVSSFFTPKNFQALENADLDFGVTQVLLIPNTNRAMTGCKDGNLYLLDRDNMGGYNAGANNVVQTINLGTNAHLRSSLSYYKGEQNEYVYSWSENGLLKAFPYNRTTNQFDLANTISSGVQGPIGNNGALLSVSSNGAVDSTSILWASYAANGDANQSVRPGVLRAFNAADVTKELWNSLQDPNDNVGNYAKFNCPTIANGKVYLATFSNKLVVYGLKDITTTPDTCNSVNIALNKTIVASSQQTGLSAAAAVDGNLNTRWSSEYSDPQSVYVDLGARFDLCRVVLKWETALGKDYSIQVSEDAVNWKTIISITGNTDFINILSLQGSGRYVRLYGTARGSAWGYSLWEFEVYGKPSLKNCGDPFDLYVTDIYENAASLHWNKNGATKFAVQYKATAAANWTTLTTDANVIALSGISCATDYLFRVQNICNTSDSGNYSTATAFSTLACNANCGPLPTRWSTQDVGTVAIAGSACYNNGVFELNASGNDIWDTQDAFHFAYKTLVGNGELKARVSSMDQSNPWNKCGIMFRENLLPGSKNIFLAITSGNGISYQTRLATDANTTHPAPVIPGIVPSYQLKMVKKDSLFIAYISPDGNTWTLLGDTVDVGFGSGTPVYVGLALTSHDNNLLSSATVDSYQFTGIIEIELLDFTATLTPGRTVDLQWTTTLERNIKNFTIERSQDNINYSDIDSVPAVNNGRYTQTYHAEDNNPMLSFNYYRLRITNNEGIISYSPPFLIRLDNPGGPLMYPNPAKNMLTIAQDTELIKMISFYDISGRLVSRLENNTNSLVRIPVSSFANGVYIVELRTATTTFRKKILIRN